MNKCLDCGKGLPPSATKPKKFCSDGCRKSYRRKNIHEREQHQQRGRKERRHEWYSPPEIVAAARRVMGGIDLDPASCVQANQIVQALRYYDESLDGLVQPWHGRVWLNPPYDTLAPRFVVKFYQEYAAGHIPSACLLLAVHHLTTRWFQGIAEGGAIFCLPAGRLKFSGRLAQGNPPMHGSVILGIGVNFELFRQQFGPFGLILEAGAKEMAIPAPRPLVVVS